MAAAEETEVADVFLNASLPIDGDLLNLTNASFLADAGFSGYEFPSDWVGVVVFVVLCFMVLSLCAAYCYSPSPQTALIVALANLVLTIPISNIFGVAGSLNHNDLVAREVVGWYQFVCLLVSLYYSYFVVTGAMKTTTPNYVTVPYLEAGDKEYPHEYVGCGKCGEVLSKSSFVSCKTCTDQKAGGFKAFELCNKCAAEHDKAHVMLLWENDYCKGMIDWEATARQNHAAEKDSLIGGQNG
mmetsp:Transcript_47698/g.137333  ORF Transcript_47698/g.137333 Transcript_47698/m.137333 type:complete len:242 (-) Transcript_47698:248-973(-)